MAVGDESSTRPPSYQGWKPELHARALALRRAGCPVGEIARALDVAKSTAYLWTRHLPLDPELVHRRRRIAQQARADAQWSAHRAARDAARAAVVAESADWVRRLDRRELLLIGAAIYWCEGGKAKPWRPNDCRIKFVNSDPLLVMLFLRFLDAIEVPVEDRRFRVSIHETADDAAAVRWWAARVGVPPEGFQPTTIKRHRPLTRRKNVGVDYHGCLTVHVVGGVRLYWRIEGIMKGMSDEDPRRDR
ncbi:resolvase [Micromonospora tulbaghiae]|uniref:Resolvase n=1 Tax=Micromonospora tulbaghiae TaxID=479978 RepID=A0AAW4JDA4_9ACTN|nr:resolvase [Micromonospora tulbaghiae]MBO4139339.1 resolvase [Micromonospora tulbaghiae]